MFRLCSTYTRCPLRQAKRKVYWTIVIFFLYMLYHIVAAVGNFKTLSNVVVGSRITLWGTSLRCRLLLLAVTPAPHEPFHAMQCQFDRTLRGANFVDHLLGL